MVVPDGKLLWDYVKRYNPKILSAPAKNIPDSSIGKIIWVHQNLGAVEVLLRRSCSKKDYANKNSIFIDDMEKNISQWREEGGIGILHKNALDTIQQLKDYLE